MRNYGNYGPIHKTYGLACGIGSAGEHLIAEA